MKKIFYIYLFLVLMCFQACYEDLGNYDYNRLPELQIQGIESDYGVKMIFEDSLIIQPEIVFGDENLAHFDMHWYQKEKEELVPISDGKDLRIILTKSGMNNFMFEVTHKELGISTRFHTRVAVSSQMQRGMYVLKETTDGNTEMDAFIRIDENEYKLFSDLIQEKLGKPLPGKPVSLDYWDWMLTEKTEEGTEQTMKRVIRPVSQKDMAMFFMDDLSYLGGMDVLFFDPIEGDLEIQAVKSIPGITVMVYNNGKVRTIPNNKASRFQMEYNGDYEVFPNFCYADKRGGGIVVFDKVSSSFKRVSNTTTKLGLFGDEVMPGLVQPMNDLNSDILYMGRAEGNLPPLRDYAGIGYAILYPKGEPDNLQLYYFTLNTLWRNMTGGRSIIDRVEPLPKEVGIRRGRLFTMHSYEPMLFYVIDNKVYGYNLNSKQETIVINDIDFPAGMMPEEITYMKHVRFTYDDKGQNFNHLFVGGYKGGKYMLFAFPVSNGRLTGEPIVWTGNGRLKDIRYTSLGKSGVNDFYFW